MFDRTLTKRIFLRINVICFYEHIVIFNIVFIVELVIDANVMRWSLIRRLLYNVLLNIIKTFFIIILITRHNFSN
jgi:hypothetical protein